MMLTRRPNRSHPGRLGYQVRHLLGLCLPGRLYRRLCPPGDRPLVVADPVALKERLAYYNRLDAPFELPLTVEPFRLRLGAGQRNYQFDLNDLTRYFPPACRLDYAFGDITAVPPRPTVVKSRPIGDDNRNAVLLRLNTVRHFHFVEDRRRYADKRDLLVWRGRAWQPHRQAFLERFHAHPRCDVGHYHPRHHDSPWTRPGLSSEQQLAYKFILAIEGNDVASSLKWTLASNSLCFMTRPRYETWFMEGRLVAGRHYVQLRDDYSDLDAKLTHYLAHPEAAQAIIREANRWVAPFRDARRERLLGQLVLWRYFHLSGQLGPPPVPAGMPSDLSAARPQAVAA